MRNRVVGYAIAAAFVDCACAPCAATCRRWRSPSRSPQPSLDAQ